MTFISGELLFLHLANWPLLTLLVFLQCYSKYSKWKHPKRTSKRLKRNIIHKHLIFYISITKYYPSLRNLTDGIMHFFTLKQFYIHTSNHNSLKEIKNLLTIIHCTSIIFFLKLLKMLTCWINECCKYQLSSIQLKHNENVQCANSTSWASLSAYLWR